MVIWWDFMRCTHWEFDIATENHHMFNGKTHNKSPFSTAMLNYWRVEQVESRKVYDYCAHSPSFTVPSIWDYICIIMCIGEIKVNSSTKKINIIEVSGYHGEALGMFTSQWFLEQDGIGSCPCNNNLINPTRRPVKMSMPQLVRLSMGGHSPPSLIYIWTRRIWVDWFAVHQLMHCGRLGVYVVSFKQQLLRNIQSKRTILTLSIFEHL